MVKEEYDAEKDAYLMMGLGLSVLHISDNDVKRNLEGVIATVKHHHGTTPPKHHPAASGGTPPKEGNLSAAPVAAWEMPYHPADFVKKYTVKISISDASSYAAAVHL
jgi:hypothetical protein